MVHPVEVGLHRQVAVRTDLREQGLHDAGQVSGAIDDRGAAPHLDAVDGERWSDGRRPVVEQGTGRDLRGLHVGLVERVDPEQPARDRDRVLPGQQHRSERTGDLDLAIGDLASVLVVADQAHDLEVRQVLGELGGVDVEHDRQDALAELAGGLGDQLFGPVSEADDVRAIGDDAELVLEGTSAGDGGTEHETGVLRAVDRELDRHRLRLVEELIEVDAGEAGRDETERGECRIPTADIRVRVEDPVAVGARCDIQRRTGVGHDDDALEVVDSGVAERLLVDALLAVSLQRRARLGGDHDRGGGQAVIERCADLLRVGRVEHRELDPVRLRDDLGRQRRSAHPTEHEVVHAGGAELGAERDDIRHQWPGDRDRLRPAEALPRLLLRVRPPQGGILSGDAAGHEV